mmetsp:Transcript_14130/g.23987  ORF Transcript_14130/g.23987 Transcript_14130/m.23987 type:complete len:324 (+) Transcript_14130:362-1333(+)
MLSKPLGEGVDLVLGGVDEDDGFELFAPEAFLAHLGQMTLQYVVHISHGLRIPPERVVEADFGKVVNVLGDDLGLDVPALLIVAEGAGVGPGDVRDPVESIEEDGSPHGFKDGVDRGPLLLPGGLQVAPDHVNALHRGHPVKAAAGFGVDALGAQVVEDAEGCLQLLEAVDSLVDGSLGRAHLELVRACEESLQIRVDVQGRVEDALLDRALDVVVVDGGEDDHVGLGVDAPLHDEVHALVLVSLDGLEGYGEVVVREVDVLRVNVDVAMLEEAEAADLRQQDVIDLVQLRLLLLFGGDCLHPLLLLALLQLMLGEGSLETLI